jgi:indole-3-glycerol phosphate synthase/phosphoribosylanthranilate isomerase
LATQLLKGKLSSRHRDLVLVNAAMAMKLAGLSEDLVANYQAAKKQLETGIAYQLLLDYKKPSIMRDIVEQNERNLPDTSRPEPKKSRIYRGGLIAEIKHASPSEGELSSKINVRTRAKLYEEGGAKAISVVVEPRFFGGNYDDIKIARDATSLPILCKDFITRKEQIYHAAEAGADIILLIVAILEKDALHELKQTAEDLGLYVLVETHTQSEFDIAVDVGSELIGINRRNLHDFSIDYQLFDKLDIPENIVVIAESGIEARQQIPERADGHLVGTSLMKDPFPKLKLKELGLQRPILKLCGLRSSEDAALCEELGVDMIGLNFVHRSRRKISIEIAKEIVGKCKNTITVGVFEDNSQEEVERIIRETGIDAVQLPVSCNFTDKISIPVLRVAPYNYSIEEIDKNLKPKYSSVNIVDNKLGGSGKTFDYEKYIWKKYPSLIAGGVDLETAIMLLRDFQPLGVDTASGIETDGKVDQVKIKSFAELFKETNYGN